MKKRLPATVKRYIDAAHVCRIATVRPDSRPHVIPVCPVFDGDATVYVDLAPDSVTARGLRANPRVAVLIDEYDDDWTYDHYWEAPEQVEEYAEALLGPRKAK